MKFVPSWMQALGQTAQAMPPQGQGMLRPLRTLEQLRGDYLAADSDLDLANSLLSTEYVPNSGALGALAMMFNAYQGRKTKEDANKRISDILREQGELMTRQEREELEREQAKAQAEFDRKLKAAQAAGYTPQQALAVAEGVPLPKEKDAYDRWLESQSPDRINQAFSVKAGLAPRPGSGTSVNIAAPMTELQQAVAAGDITAEEARRIRREKLGAELPLKDQMAADADAANQAARAETRAGNADSVLQEIRAAKEAVGPLTAGAGGAILSRVPGTSARDLQARLQTVTANLSFDRLQQMREESKTGGALGGIAVKELDLLGSALVSLDQAQSPQQLLAALEKAEKHYGRYLDLRSQFQGSQPGQIIPNSQRPRRSLEEILRDRAGG